MKAHDQIDDILFALGPSHESFALILGIALRILAENIHEAEFESGMKMRDLSDVRVFLIDCADAARDKSRKAALRA
jgi:hypothetical protein